MPTPNAVAKPSVPLMEVREAPGVYADALLRDERGGLLFVSLWGRDTALQELQARLSLPVSDGGVTMLHITQGIQESRVNLDRINCMEKHSGRLPARNLFGDVAQLWIYDRLATEPDRANRVGLLFLRGSNTSDGLTENELCRIWQLVREVSHLPLLPHWREPVLEVLDTKNWLRRLDDGAGVQAWRVELGDPAFETAISQLMHAGVLHLEPETSTAVAPPPRQGA